MQVGPYNRIGKDNYSVAMIWRNHKFVCFDRHELSCQFQPSPCNHFTCAVWLHLVVDNVAE